MIGLVSQCLIALTTNKASYFLNNSSDIKYCGGRHFDLLILIHPLYTPSTEKPIFITLFYHFDSCVIQAMHKVLSQLKLAVKAIWSSTCTNRFLIVTLLQTNQDTPILVIGASQCENLSRNESSI